MDALLASPAFSLHRPAVGRPSTTPLLVSLLGHGLLLALPLLALKTPLPVLPPNFSVTLLAASTVPAPTSAVAVAQSPAVKAPPLSAPAASPAPAAVLTTKTSAITTPAPTSSPTPAPASTVRPMPAVETPSSTPQPAMPVLPPSAGAAAGASSAKSGPMTDNNALAQYGQSISEWLARQQRYPRLAEMRGWEGEVRLHLRIARKGALIDVQISHSSGHEVLDRSALQLVQGGALPPPPANLGLGNDETLDITVPVHYRLRRT